MPKTTLKVITNADPRNATDTLKKIREKLDELLYDKRIFAYQIHQDGELDSGGSLTSATDAEANNEEFI